METKLLKVEAVAAVLGLSKSFVYQLIRLGQLPAVRLGHAVRVRPEDLDHFIQTHLSSSSGSLSSPVFGTGRV